MLPLASLVVAWGCGADPLEVDGQFGRPMALASGDQSPLPRLAFVDEGCPGGAAQGGCDASGDRACQTLLIDSLAPLTAVRDPSAGPGRLSIECLEVRTAHGLAQSPALDEDRAAAVARFRFDNLPLIRAADGEQWSWTAGSGVQPIEPGGILGGNLLRNFAVSLRTPAPALMDATQQVSEVSLFGEFPGSERDLADQGRAFLPLQFPGRLLGRELTDRCRTPEGPCELDGYDASTSSNEIPLVGSRMVMDACVAIPPCGVQYEPASTGDPFAPGRCELLRGPTSRTQCLDPTDDQLGGLSASLVVATSVPGLVLFSDSATRMFGDLSQMEPCPAQPTPLTEVAGDLRACLVDEQGVLHLPGWPSAGEDAPLTRLRIRSLALVPGAAQSRSAGPCERASDRREALFLQCDRYQDTARITGDIRDAAPPYSAKRDDDDGEDHTQDPAARSLAVLGESTIAFGASGPRPVRWIPTTILPATHPLAQAVRRDVAPDALEPDGLLGTVLLDDTKTVLDYTDLNPSLRVACLEPHEGRCQVLPDCVVDRSLACCHGLPRTMLSELIRTLRDDTCCGALSEPDLRELQRAGHCREVLPP